MVILKKILGSIAITIFFMIGLHESCFAASPLTMEIKQAEIAKNVSDKSGSGDMMIRFVSKDPRIRVLLELKNNGTDTLFFHNSGSTDLFTTVFTYNGKIYGGENTTISMFGSDFKIPPGETLPVSLFFYPPPLRTTTNAMKDFGYSQFLWDILPTLTITYQRDSKWYGEEYSIITASWGDWDDIMISKVSKGRRE